MQDMKDVMRQRRPMRFVVRRCVSPQGFSNRLMSSLNGSLSTGCFPAEFYLAFA